MSSHGKEPCSRDSAGTQGEPEPREPSSGSPGVTEECLVCFEPFGEVLCSLDSCRHRYCWECIIQWAEDSTRCPTCKLRFTKIVKLKAEQEVAAVEVPQRDLAPPQELGEGDFVDSGVEEEEDQPCQVCQSYQQEDLLLLCDRCDGHYHTFCVGLGLVVPPGDWFCPRCQHAEELRPSQTSASASASSSSSSSHLLPTAESQSAAAPTTPGAQGSTGLVRHRIGVRSSQAAGRAAAPRRTPRARPTPTSFLEQTGPTLAWACSGRAHRQPHEDDESSCSFRTRRKKRRGLPDIHEELKSTVRRSTLRRKRLAVMKAEQLRLDNERLLDQMNEQKRYAQLKQERQEWLLGCRQPRISHCPHLPAADWASRASVSFLNMGEVPWWQRGSWPSAPPPPSPPLPSQRQLPSSLTRRTQPLGLNGYLGAADPRERGSVLAVSHVPSTSAVCAVPEASGGYQCLPSVNRFDGRDVDVRIRVTRRAAQQIGRASCREKGRSRW
eukprot:RCo022864